MSEDNKTHYRKAFNSPYLSSADIVGPTVLTVERVSLEPDKSKKTKDHFNTAHFLEKEIRRGEALKPMILNAHNSRIMRDFADSHFIDDWNNISVTIYVDSKVRFGANTVEGLRISPEKPSKRPVITIETPKLWQNAIDAYKRDGSFKAVLERADISEEDQQFIIEGCKNDTVD